MDFEGISGVAYSKTGELAISCKGDDVYLLDTRRAAASLNSEDRIFKSFNVPITHVPAKRYVGRKNVKTFLKGVAFMCDDEYVTTGGDDGNLYVWNKETCELVCKMQADSQVVNTVLPHPHLPTLVCCGIDNHVRVFEAGDGGVHLGTPPKRDENDPEGGAAGGVHPVFAPVFFGFVQVSAVAGKALAGEPLAPKGKVGPTCQ